MPDPPRYSLALFLGYVEEEEEQEFRENTLTPLANSMSTEWLEIPEMKQPYDNQKLANGNLCRMIFRKNWNSRSSDD